jgi:hypothetical protein
MGNPYDMTNPSNVRPQKFDFERQGIFSFGLPDVQERLEEKLPIQINLPGGGRPKSIKSGNVVPAKFTSKKNQDAYKGLEVSGPRLGMLSRSPNYFYQMISNPMSSGANTNVRFSTKSPREKFADVIKDYHKGKLSEITTRRFEQKRFFDKEHGMDKKFFDFFSKLGFPIPKYYSSKKYDKEGKENPGRGETNITTYPRNLRKNAYQDLVNKAIIAKDQLVNDFKNKKISKGNFLMQKEGIDSQMNLIHRDLSKLGLQIVVTNSKGKLTTFGKNMTLTQLYNDIPKNYRLNIMPVSYQRKSTERTKDFYMKGEGFKQGGLVGISHLIRPL